MIEGFLEDFPSETPVARFNSVTVDHNTMRDGQIGMLIHVHFSLANLKGQQCWVGAFFQLANGQILKDSNGRCSSSDGQVAVGMEVVPTYDDTLWKDLQLFMPYEELHVTAGHRHDCRFVVQAHRRSSPNGTWTSVGNSEYTSFNYDAPLPISPLPPRARASALPRIVSFFLFPLVLVGILIAAPQCGISVERIPWFHWTGLSWGGWALVTLGALATLGCGLFALFGPIIGSDESCGSNLGAGFVLAAVYAVGIFLATWGMPLSSTPNRISGSKPPVSAKAANSGVAASTGLPVPPVAGNTSGLTVASQNLARVRKQLKDDLAPAIQKLTTDRDEVKKRLQAAGVKSSADLKDNYKAQALAQELTEIVGYLRVMEQKQATYEKAAFELETLIRRLERRQIAEKAGLTQEEMAEVATTLRTIDTQLADASKSSPVTGALEIDKTVDEELKK